MARHIELNPDNAMMVLDIASTALQTARRLQTRKAANVYIPSGDGTGVLIGDTAENGGISRYDPESETQSPLWEGISQEELDAKADEILGAAKEDTAAQITIVNTTITEAQQAIEANREGLEQEAYLRAEADRAARETSDAIKAETDKLKGDYDGMATDVASVKQDMLDTVSRVESVEGTQEQQAKDIEKASGTANTAKGTAESAERTANAAKQLATDNAAKTITGSVIEYAVGGATAAPTSGWTTGNVTRPAGATVWMRTKITYGDGRTTVTGATPVTGDTGPMGQQGPQGATGATGVSVTALTTYYVLAASKPAKPAGKNPEGAWTTTEPALDRASNLWTSTRVDYSDGQWAWTEVTQSGAYKMAQAAQNSAEDAARLAQNADTLSQTTAGEVDRLDKAHAVTAATANSAAQAAASAQALLNVLSAQTQELLYNGGFESGDEQDDGWVAGVGSKPHRQQSAYARSGSYCAYLSTDAGIASRELISQHPIPVTVGARYRFQYWYKLVSAGAATAGGPRLQKSTDGINWSDCQNCPNTSLIEVQTWTRQTMDYVVEDGVKYIRARIAFDQPVNAYFDDASITDVSLVYEAEQQAEQATQLARKLETDLANSNARLEAAEAAVIGAQTTADSKNKRFVQPTEPTYDLLKPGDEWWQTSSKPPETYWMGEPNNSVSVLVDHSGEVEHIWTWNGTRWADLTLAADSLFVRGTVSAGLVSADFFDGAVVKGGAFVTSNERIQLNNNGFTMVDSAGNPVVTLDAKTGEAILQSVNIIGAGISTPAISGGSIEGADYQLTAGTGANKQVVARINSDGVVFGDHLSYAKNDAGQWVLSLKGAIQTGGEISGPVITAPTIQTSSAEKTGLKLTTGGLVAFDTDGHTTFMLDNAGRIMMAGALLSNGEITGATLQTYPDDAKGVKIRGSELVAWSDNGKEMINLDGRTGTAILTGGLRTARSGSRIVIGAMDAGSSVGLADIIFQTDYGQAWDMSGAFVKLPDQTVPGAGTRHENTQSWTLTVGDTSALNVFRRKIGIGDNTGSSSTSAVIYTKTTINTTRFEISLAGTPSNGDDPAGVYVAGRRIDDLPRVVHCRVDYGNVDKNTQKTFTYVWPKPFADAGSVRVVCGCESNKAATVSHSSATATQIDLHWWNPNGEAARCVVGMLIATGGNANL
ncbi:hypothetical protein PG2049B_1297 [Bifidobacterium pseudolongum subsp. globosum]|uniref:Uncharacterized protein n=1 Tax=Bifidobacterium pseudolongum subsp. globosum TaxID=1690 RepID=A0A4Q5AKJ9_9BIFI|nr:hypothetical protein [Bifidobacterium pseudolongum]RYQ21413.1 hypothetical protein PG2049B_1297 [Bifidobacterium pseudolongum subsp. globosum]RYQ29979.1 hypothetical protein PG2017B_1262 [Bifidobacterium pseudolongum subsp. globosum]